MFTNEIIWITINEPNLKTQWTLPVKKLNLTVIHSGSWVAKAALTTLYYLFSVIFNFYSSFLNWAIGQKSRVFANSLEDRGSIIPKLKKWYLMPPCLIFSIIRCKTRVKMSNLGNGVDPFPTLRCSSYLKRDPSGHPQLRSPAFPFLSLNTSLRYLIYALSRRHNKW